MISKPESIEVYKGVGNKEGKRGQTTPLKKQRKPQVLQFEIIFVKYFLHEKPLSLNFF